MCTALVLALDEGQQQKSSDAARHHVCLHGEYCDNVSFGGEVKQCDKLPVAAAWLYAQSHQI